MKKILILTLIATFNFQTYCIDKKESEKDEKKIIPFTYKYYKSEIKCCCLGYHAIINGPYDLTNPSRITFKELKKSILDHISALDKNLIHYDSENIKDKYWFFFLYINEKKYTEFKDDDELDMIHYTKIEVINHEVND